MEGGEEVTRLLGDLGSNLPVADFDIGSSDAVSISVVPWHFLHPVFARFQHAKALENVDSKVTLWSNPNPD